MHTHIPAAGHRQRGVSTLVVAIVLLIAATFLTFFAAKIGMQEQRMSGNDYRHKEAFSTAEAGLDRAKAFLAANRMDFATWGWTACAGTETTPPCGDGTANLFNTNWSWINVYRRSSGAALAGLNWPQSTADGPFILTRTTGDSFQPVVLAAQARSLDGTGRAVVRQSMSRYLIAQPGPVPPIMAPTVPLGGNFTVVGNPNHDLDLTEVTLANCDSLTGSGQMLSIWSEGAVPTSGTWKTCSAGSFREGTSSTANRCIGVGIPDPATGDGPSTDAEWHSCNCQDNAAEKSPYSGGSTGSGVGINEDVVDSDPDFPGDIFLYVFGRPKSAVKASAAAAGHILPDCSSLNASSTGLYWVTGNCDMPANSTVGSRAAPAIVVFEGNASFRSNSHFWGMVVGADMQRSCPGATPTDPYSVDTACTSTDGTPNEVDVNGTFTVHGAMIVEGEVDGVGDYKAVYDPCVFAAMGAGTSFDQYGPVAGSWNDAL
ncbi:MAG: PilX N-terminal domain-containing pilus assembly protein [Immundisolibacter sp.]|uniref:pilus assembly PilX family protein n=1 Tax=Immundisolibacter sp. TaxID=1934948 RepID=UPI003D0DF6C3